ncbi:hypothetical protein DL89DRAFT_298297 [Linderina pennispora]|uniref:VPS9 domain-containing protein n=1 Tax=Linderina pennispora TaxID=61395 RepID=A0A1Y1VQK4_9FUNG|nr:uncharacterized protein DL89DRAFT_298297 [Linderina pennispora]ORX63581.1 hypothetical protein DL89DRAFT_298297 [Linderina pennispora]
MTKPDTAAGEEPTAEAKPNTVETPKADTAGDQPTEPIAVPDASPSANEPENSTPAETLAEALPPPPVVQRVSSTSKVHDAIQDIINQFDPLKISASQSTQAAEAAASEQTAELRAQFQPETDGFNYNTFLQQLRNPEAKPVARTVKNFLTEFARRPLTLGEQVRFIHDFLDFISGKMRECSVWMYAGEREFENAREGMEKLVMNRLYPVCFSPTASDDADKDRVLREKVSLFRWIKEEHLDIPKSPQNTAFLQFAKTELLKMNNFKSPRDKVICVLNCCTVIYGLLKHMKGNDVGADKFLPLLIYVVITAAPPKLVSNIQYIMRFRSAEKMQSEAGYYVTNLQGAVAFIESMDASCLSITQDEFDKNIEMTIWEIETEKRGKERTAQQKRQEAQRRPVPDLSAERAQWLIDKGSGIAKTTLEKTNNFVGRLISELSTPNASETGATSPSRRDSSASTQYPGESSRQPRHQREYSHSQQDTANVQELIMGTSEWTATLALVRDMFPNIDSEVVEIVFESNQGFVPKTIEQLLDMSMGNEARDVVANEEVLDELESPVHSMSQRTHVVPPPTAAAPQEDGDDAVDEVERWKDRWADGSSDEEEEDEVEEDLLKEEEDDDEITAPPDLGQTSVPDTTIPDTSGDEELARRLQQEFEQQMRDESSAPQ